MKDEIKEIIEALENTIKDDRIPYEIESYECKILLDYIINLQEENEKLLKKSYSDDVKITKAIEYINKNKHLSMFADCREPEEDWNYDLEINPSELLNILQGEDKDE